MIWNKCRYLPAIHKSNMNHLRFQTKEWDSNFFGIRVASLQVSEADDLSNFEEKYANEIKAYDLIYIFAEKPLRAEITGKTQGRVSLVDEKVTFHKTLRKKFPKEDFIVPYNEHFRKEDIIKIGIQSGTQSRFKIDPQISEEKFEELYRLWMEKSLQGELADLVLVCREEEENRGIITLGINEDQGFVGLFAVKEQFRGRGYGSLLLQATENWLLDQKVNQLEIVTQGFSKLSVDFYKKSGFEIKKTQYVYHYWSQKEA